MTKRDFLTELQKSLGGFPSNDVRERMSFYSEIIDDKTEEGLSEEEAVATLGPINKIVSQIIAETPLKKLIKERVTPKRSLRAWEITLLALGSPIWLSLIIAALAAVISVYAAIWSVLTALWATVLALAVSSLGGALGCIGFIILQSADTGFLLLGVGVICAGLTIFMFLGCIQATKGFCILTKKIFIAIKSCFVRKGEQK